MHPSAPQRCRFEQAVRNALDDAFALAHNDDLVGPPRLDAPATATGPPDCEPVHDQCTSPAEMGTHVVLGEVAGAAPDLPERHACPFRPGTCIGRGPARNQMAQWP